MSLEPATGARTQTRASCGAYRARGWQELQLEPLESLATRCREPRG